MGNWFFQSDSWALFLLIFFWTMLLIFRGRLSVLFKPFVESRASFSLAGSLKDISQGNFKILLARTSPYILLFSLIFLSFAFVNPRVYFVKDAVKEAFLESEKEVKDDFKEETLPVEGLGIYMVLDRSGSMSNVIGEVHSKPVSRMDLLKVLTEKFLSGEGIKGFAKRSNDMIGLVSFARVPEVRYPLTLDRKGLIEEVRKLEVVEREEEDGTAIGYALYKTINYLKATKELANQLDSEKKYFVKGSVIILVTDGLNNPSELDLGNSRRQTSLEEAAALAQKNNVHIYIINIESRLDHPMYAQHLRTLRKVSALTSGQFYLLDDPSSLSKVYEDIEKREKSKYSLKLFKQADDSKKENKEEKMSWEDYEEKLLFPYFAILSLFSLILFIGIESIFLSRLS
jgi:Ca-activated chloride channel homolog